MFSMIAATMTATIGACHMDGCCLYTARLRAHPAPNQQAAIWGTSVILAGHAPPAVVETG